jgi:hypothetical protein
LRTRHCCVSPNIHVGHARCDEPCDHWLTKPEIKFNVFNLTDKHALTVDSATTLLATKGPLDPTTGKALYAGGAYYNLLEPHTFMITLRASLF